MNRPIEQRVWWSPPEGLIVITLRTNGGDGGHVRIERVSPDLRTTVRAHRAYRQNFSLRGLLLIWRLRWRTMLLAPRQEYEQASALADGAFT